MTKKSNISWQKPSFGPRVFQRFLLLGWMSLIPVFIYYCLRLCAYLSLREWMDTLPILGLALLSGIVVWKMTFWWVCQKIPSLYPLRLLMGGLTSKRLWRRPPLYFYTQAFQKEFQERWVPYFKTFKNGDFHSSSSRGGEDTFSKGRSDLDEMSWRSNPFNPSHPDYSRNISSCSSSSLSTFYSALN